MAIFLPSAIIGGISGSLKSLTFKNTRNGLQATSRPIKTKRTTPAQKLHQAHFAYLMTTWATTTIAQRAAWKSFARNVPVTNTLGLPHFLTGFQMYIRHNAPALNAGLLIQANPPNNTQLEPPSKLLINSAMSTFFKIGLIIPAAVSPVYVISQGCRPFSSSPNVSFNSWKTFDASSVGSGVQVLTLTTQWDLIFGRPLLTEYVAVRVYLFHSQYLASPHLLSTVQRAF